jgi:lysyl-tRNA synthetase class 2
MNETNEINQEQDLSEVLRVRRDKLAQLQAEGRNPFEEVKYPQPHHTADITAHFEEMDGREVSVAGRLMSKRVKGKASFCDLTDRDGKIQLYIGWTTWARMNTPASANSISATSSASEARCFAPIWARSAFP